MCKVISVVNQKGGVGKTTTTVNVGIGLAREGKKVLLIDADPQGSLTASLGYEEPDDLRITLATIMMDVINEEEINLEDGILHHQENVDLLPANIELSALEVTMGNVMSREMIMKEYIDAIRSRYDYILIDCMPSLGMMTINALVSSDSVLIPVQAAYLPVKGLQQLIKTILTVKKRLNRKLAYFFQALENDDYSIHFPEYGGSHSERFLNGVLNRIKDILQNTRLEIQQREQFYELIINSVSSGIVALDERGFVTQNNQVALKLLGLEIFTHVNQLERVSPALKLLVTEIRPGESRRVTFTNERGSVQLFVSASRILLKDKPITLLVMNDIENELDEKEIDSWVRLIRVLSHEIMNSIAPVTSLSDTLLSMHSDPEITSDDLKRNTENGLKVISETGKGLISFVESYRKFTRIPRPERELINLNEFIQRAVILSSTEPNFPEVTIDVCIEPEDLKVFADPNLMGQVLLNLMKNAFYALRGREDAHITLSAEHGPTGKVLIRVRDNGPGISPEIMNEIFVPFFTTKEEGSGIGLSVSRQIMRMHGGNLKVSSIEGKETVFTIII